MRHVPQCVVYEPQQRRLRSYSPLGELIRLAASNDSVTITRGAAERLRQHGSSGWVVELADDQRTAQTIGPVDACILAASAIGNVQVLARSAGETMTTHVTDHMALGAIVRIHRGDSLGAFEHREIWHGYTPIPGLGRERLRRRARRPAERRASDRAAGRPRAGKWASGLQRSHSRSGPERPGREHDDRHAADHARRRGARSRPTGTGQAGRINRSDSACRCVDRQRRCLLDEYRGRSSQLGLMRAGPRATMPSGPS